MLFFTSDHHFHHVRALELMPNRPWATLEDMNEGLIQNYNSVVGSSDTVVFLGDLIMGPKAVTVPSILPRLNGMKVLLLGNHDAGFNQSDLRKRKIYRDYGVEVFSGNKYLPEVIGLTPGFPDILLSHFPYKGVPDHEGQPVRYYDLRPEPSNTLLLHGHTHQAHKVTGPNMIHVGVDSWEWMPVSIVDILDLYKEMTP